MVSSPADAAALLPWIVGLPLMGALVCGLGASRLPRPLVGGVACSAVAAAFALCVQVAQALGAGHAPLSAFVAPWFEVGALSVPVQLSCDPLAALMLLIITGVGALIHLYSVGYMAADGSFGRYFACLNLFVAAMLTLVLADSLPLMFVGWEGVGLCSYLLIGFWYEGALAAAAGRRAFVVNRLGDLGLLVSMFVLWQAAGSLRFAALNEAAAAGVLTPQVAQLAALALLLAAAGKSAQVPLYVWLPDAMAGPTPASALIHAATMVTAGVYLVARLHAVFALVPLAQLAMAWMGAASALWAALLACAQADIKRVLAYSTISQLGFMFMAAGAGAYGVALLHVTTHAFFKACLFLGAGAVIHACGGVQDLAKMGGLARRLPGVTLAFVLAGAALAGLPPTAGFVSKDAVLAAVFHAPGLGAAAKPLWAVGLMTAALTAAYISRVVLLAFFGTARGGGEAVHAPPWQMGLPIAALAAGAGLGGALAWPPLLGGADRLGTWLEPVFGAAPAAPSAAVEAGLTLAAVAAAVLGGGAAWALGPGGPAAAVAPLWRARGRAAALAGGWVDVGLERAVVRPGRWLARVGLGGALERGLDGAVEAVAWGARTLGFFAQLLQSGNLQRYLAIFVLAVAVLVQGWIGPWGGGGTLRRYPLERPPQGPADSE